MSLVRAYYGCGFGSQTPGEAQDAAIDAVMRANGGERLSTAIHLSGDRSITYQFDDENEAAARKASDELIESGFFVTDGAWVRNHSGGAGWASKKQREAA